MPEQPNGATDFTATKIATTVTKHDEEFITVKGRLDLLEARFGKNEKCLSLVHSWLTISETSKFKNQSPRVM
jgi:hypothetical protein